MLVARDDPGAGPLRCGRRGTFVSPVGKGAPALERFLHYCRFDSTTGCVLWTGGTTSGRGHNAPYGAFKYEGRRWYAHRWSAKFIHGLEIDDRQVDHCCPPNRAGWDPLPPNTLCVQHVQALVGSENRSLQDERRLWILTQKGLLEPPPLFAELMAPPELVPFVGVHERPAWLGPDNS